VSARQPFAAAIPDTYRPRLHAAMTVLFVVGGVAAALSALSRVRPLEWLALPMGFFAANLVEYLGHRFLLHRRTRLAAFAFDTHVRRHHACFPPDHMEIDAPSETWLILFGVKEAAMCLLSAAPFALAARVASANASALTWAAFFVEYGLYELVHLASHLPPDASLARCRVLAVLRRRHAAHHGDASANFSVTLPLCDWLFGTLRDGRD
jgi:sterol desaturase/sphingolipid hydroxylase (fatty acid hydroxylase superfamily)